MCAFLNNILVLHAASPRATATRDAFPAKLGRARHKEGKEETRETGASPAELSTVTQACLICNLLAFCTNTKILNNNIHVLRAI